MYFEDKEDNGDRAAAEVREDLLIQLRQGGVKVKVMEINIDSKQLAVGYCTRQ
ncbi:MAG: hypothetical protein PUP90_01895 [Nostoc sp. S4]|nr:hypothetical protein [Nostoc sp. S4]